MTRASPISLARRRYRWLVADIARSSPISLARRRYRWLVADIARSSPISLARRRYRSLVANIARSSVLCYERKDIESPAPRHVVNMSCVSIHHLQTFHAIILGRLTSSGRRFTSDMWPKIRRLLKLICCDILLSLDFHVDCQ